MQVQSTGNQQLFDPVRERGIPGAEKGQGNVASHQIPQHTDANRVLLQLLEPGLCQRSSRQTVDPVGAATVLVLAKPPFVLG